MRCAPLNSGKADPDGLRHIQQHLRPQTLDGKLGLVQHDSVHSSALAAITSSQRRQKRRLVALQAGRLKPSGAVHRVRATCSEEIGCLAVLLGTYAQVHISFLVLAGRAGALVAAG